MLKSKNTSGVYIIEKIIRRNKNKYFVKWRNYSNEFNSWINEDDIINIPKHVISNTQSTKKYVIVKLQIRKNNKKYVIFKYAIKEKTCYHN